MAMEIEKLVLTVIGRVSNDIRSLEEAPKGYDESDRTGYLEIFSEAVARRPSSVVWSGSREIEPEGAPAKPDGE